MHEQHGIPGSGHNILQKSFHHCYFPTGVIFDIETAQYLGKIVRNREFDKALGPKHSIWASKETALEQGSLVDARNGSWKCYGNIS